MENYSMDTVPTAFTRQWETSRTKGLVNSVPENIDHIFLVVNLMLQNILRRRLCHSLQRGREPNIFENEEVISLLSHHFSIVTYVHATMVGLGIGAPTVKVYHEKSFILPDVSRVLACLYEKDVKFEAITASYKSLLRLQAASHAPVPFYDGPTFLEESREICRYIAEKYEHQGHPFLLGKDALERASVEQWLHNEEHAFNPPSRALFYHLAFPLALGEEDDGIDIHIRKLEEVLDVYDQRLSDSEFLAGNKFTLADLVHLPNSHHIKACDEFLYLYDSRKNVRRWWDDISGRDSWKQVLRYMKRVEEQNKQEELKKQQQEDPRTSANSSQVDSRIRAEPRTILVPPMDTASSSYIVPRTKKPLPSDTSPDEMLISSSHSPPAADKTSPVQSKEIAMFTNPQETPPISVQSIPATSKSTKHATSPTMAKSSTKDASILKPSSSKDISSYLDVFDHYPSHTDVDTPNIGPTTQQTSETLDALSGSNIGSSHTKTSSISAREEPDQPAGSEFYKSDSTGTNLDSRFKEPVPYSGRTPPELEPTDTSTSKLHTTDVHRRPQVEQWHSTTTGLNDLKHDADHLASTQQGKARKDVQEYPSQDSEQKPSHSVPQEPMSMEVVQGREKTTRRPYTDQSRDVLSQLEDDTSSDERGAVRHPSTQEHGVIPSRQVAAKDAHRRIVSQAAYPGGQDTSKQPRDRGSLPRQGDKGIQSRVTIPESQKMVSGDAQTIHGERKIDTPGEQSSDRLQAIPQSRPHSLSNEPTSRVQPASESLQEVVSRGGLSTKPSTIEQWQRASVPLNDITSSSGDVEIGMATTDQKLAPMSQQATPSSEVVNQMAKESGEQRVEPPVQIEAETPGVQSASPSFPGASTAHHATSDDKFARQSIIDERVGQKPTKMPPTPYSAPAHTKRETPDGHENVDSELVSTPAGHISEAAKIRQDQATVHEDVHDTNLSAHDVAKDTFKEAKAVESTPSRAKPMYPQQPAPTPRHAEVKDTWDKGTKGRETVPDRQQMLEKWAGTAGEQLSGRWKASPPSRQTAAEDVRGPTGDTIQSPDVLDTSKKYRGAYEEAKGHGSIKDEKTSSIYQKKPLVAQDSQEQAQAIPAGEKADGSIRKHQQASDAPNTFVEKLNASEPARVQTHGDFSTEGPYKKDTTDDKKVAPPVSARELTSQVQPPSEPSYDAALYRDLSSKPSTIYQWQRSSVPLHDVTSSSGEVTKSTFDEKPTPMSLQKSDEKIVEPPVPIEAEISGVHASPSSPGASVDDSATIGDNFGKQSTIDERVGEPTQTQSSQDAHLASEPKKRETPEVHEIGDFELVSTPGGQISNEKKARDDPVIVHEDVYDVNLSTQDVGKDAFKETKVADSIPSSAQPMHIQQPALTPSRQAQDEESRYKSMQNRETIPIQQKMVERNTGISGERLSDRQKEIRPSRQPSAEDAPIQSPDILDTPKKSRATFEESIGPGSTLPKAHVLDAQDSQLTKGEFTLPTTDQRKDWKYAKDDETIKTEEKSLSTKRLREMFQKSAPTVPKTQLTDSEGSNALEKTSSVYHKGHLDAQDSQEEAHVIPADEKVDGSTPEHHESSGAPYTYDEKLSASAPARADIHDDHIAEEQYKKYNADDHKVAPSLSSKEPASQVQPASEPLQRAVPDGDFPSKPFSIHQWQGTAAPLHGVVTDSGDDEAAMSSNNDQKARYMSQEATPSSKSVNQMGKQSGEQRVEPPMPIVAEASDVGRAAPSLPEAARADVATISDKFTEQLNIDERMGKPKQMQAPITPEGQRLEAEKATRDPVTIHEDVYDASLSTHDAAVDEKTAMDHASGDEVVTGSLHDQQTARPASTIAQPTVGTPHDSDSFQYVHTGDLGKTELAKPTVTDQETTVPSARPTSADPQRAGIVPAEVAHSEQKSTMSDKGSAHAAQPPSPVEPIKADGNVSAANYTNAPPMIFRQKARTSAPSTIGIPASDTQGVIGKIQEVTPDNYRTDDSGKPFVPNEEHVSHASQTILGPEEMISPKGAKVFSTSDTQLASAEVHEVAHDDQQTVESITPLVSSGKHGSHVRSPFTPGEVGPADKKFAPSDRESPHLTEQSISDEPRQEQTIIRTAEQTEAPPTIIGQQDMPDRNQALTSEDTLNTTATHGEVHRTGTIEPARGPLSVQGEEVTYATQTPSPNVARDSLHTELENVQSMKPSATPDARYITPSSAPGEVVLAEQKSASSGQGSADPAQSAFSLGPRNEEITDPSSSAIRISSTGPSKGDAFVAVRDQGKDSQITPGRQYILSAEHLSGKVQENIPDDDLGKAKPSRPSSSIQEGKPSKASASGIQLGSVPNKVSVDKQTFAPPGQDSVYLARPPPSAEPRIKEIEDLAPSTRLNSTTDPRNIDAIVAAPDQATGSQTTPGKQLKVPAPSSQGPLGKLQDDEPADDSGEAKSSKTPSVVREGKPAAAVPISATDKKHGATPDQVAVEQKFAPSGQDSIHPVQTSFSTEPTKEDTVVAATDRTSILERIVDQTYMTPAADKAKTPFLGTPDASRKTQKSIKDDHIDEKLPSQGRVSPDRHVSESPRGRSPEAHSDIDNKTLGSSQEETSKTGPDSTPISADAHLSRSDMPAASSLPEPHKDDHIDEKLPSQGRVSPDRHVSESPRGRSPEAHSDIDNKTLGSSQEETSKTGPDSTPISADAHLSRSDMPAASSLPEPQDLQDSASAQNLLTDSFRKIKSPGDLSTDQSIAPLGTVSGTNSVQLPQQASTVDLESVPDTQNGIPQGKATPGEQKSAISDQEPAHTTERPSSTEPRKEANTAAGDQPNVAQGPETTAQHQANAPPPESREALQKYQQPSHAVLPSNIHDRPKETTQTSFTEPNSTPTHGDVLPTRSIQNQEAQPPPATQLPTSQGLQDSAFSQNDSSGNIESPREASTDQNVAPAINSAVPTGAPEGTEPGPNSSRFIQTPFSTEPTKEDAVVTAADQAEDMQTKTHQQAISQAPGTAKTPFPGAQDASKKIQESTPGDGPLENYSPKPGAQTQPPVATLDVPPDASSKAKSTGQGAKLPTGYQAYSPETQLGSSETQGEAAPAEQKFALSDEKSANASKSFASAEGREEDKDAATSDQTSVPLTNVTHQVTSSTPLAMDKVLTDQESSPDNGQIRNFGSPLIASEEAASRAGRASDVSTPKLHSTIVDEKRTLPSRQPQTSSTGPDSTQIGGDARLSDASVPATRSIENQEAEPPATTQAPTSKGLQDSANIESPRETSTDQTVAPVMNSATPSDAPEGTEPGPNSSRSVHAPFSTEPTKDETIVTAADQAKDMQTKTHQVITPAPGTAKPPFPGAQGASRKFQESTPGDGPVENYSPKPGAQTQPPAATLDVSQYASSKAKSTGQAAKPPTGYEASSPETHLGSSKTQGEATPAEQKFAVSDEKSANASKSFASAERREEDKDAAAADQTSVPLTNVTRQVTSSTPDASDTLSRDQESSPDDGQIRNLGIPLIASQEEASRAGRASEGFTPEVHSAMVDKKRTLPSSQAQTSRTGPDSTQIGGDAHLSGAGMPVTSSIEKQEAEPPAATQAPTSKVLRDSGNIEASTDQTVAPAMNSAAPSDAPEGSEPGPTSSRSVQTPFSTEPTKEDAAVTAADQAEDMQTKTHQQATTPAPGTAKTPFPGAQDASRKFQESSPGVGHIDEPLWGSSSEPREGQTFDPYRTNVDDKTTTFPSSQANISESGSDLAPTLGDVVPSIGEGPADNHSLKSLTQTQLPSATHDASSKAKSTGQAAKTPTGYLSSSPDTQLGSSQTQGEAAPAEERLPVSGMHPVQPAKGASFDVLTNEKTITTQDQVNTPPNGDLSSNQVVEQSESADSKGVNSQRNLEGASTNEESKSQQQADQFGTQPFKDNNKEADGTVRSYILRAFEELQEPPSRPKGKSSEELESQQLADQAIVKPLEGNEKQAEQTKPHEPGTAELEDIEGSENTNLKNNRVSQLETLDRSGKQASVFQQLGKHTKDAPNSTEDVPGDGKAVSKSEHSSRSSEEFKVQLQSEDKTQGLETDAATGHPSKGNLPANRYQNNSSQSQEEASKKSVEQSSPGIRNKDNDSSRFDDSTDPTKPET